LIGGMVHDEVDEHADAPLLCTVGEVDKVAERPVALIDAVVVGDVVAVVAMRRSLEGHQPYGRDAQDMKIVEAPFQSTEVAYAIAVGIHVGADRQAIDYGVLVPKIADHAARSESGEAPTMTPSSDCRTRGWEVSCDWRVVERRTRLPGQGGSRTAFGLLSKLSAT